MNKRLEQFLRAENISQSQFADSIGVARGSVSHILAGRNKPGFDFLLNTAKAYPALNLEWLITGKGRMYGGSKAPSSLFDDEVSATAGDVQTATYAPVAVNNTAGNGTEAAQSKAIASACTTQITESERHISKIVVFFDDNTFQELK